ncbi:MAG TPA: tetratricopeptide repeat protein [Candidatus Sulfotelmatobacter sp.]|nr:tetratricopeptide repeat protein [Candidatus Sulfotelmatobacter sp.]
MCARIFLLIAVLCVSSATQLVAQASKDANKTPQGTKQKVRNPLNDLLDEAQAAMDKNDYAAAIPPLQKFLAEKPDVAFAHFQLAYAYTALKQPEDARAEYEKCIALDPKMPEAQLNLGMLLLERDAKAAVVPLRSAVELLPSQSRPRYLLGLAQERSGDLTGAAESFEGAAHLDPKDPDSLTQLGLVYMQLNRPADAEGKFRAALRLDSKSTEALHGLALSLDAEKKPEAVQAYREYLAVQPQDAAVRSRFVHLLLEQGQNDAALAELDKNGSGKAPTVGDLKLRADIEIARKNWNGAIAALKQAIALAPNDAQLHGGLGRTYLQGRDFTNAELELKAALRLEPNNLIFWKDLSSTYYLSGNCQATLATLDVIAKVESPGAGAWFIRGLCYDKLGQVQLALDAYRKFLDLDENKNADQVWQATQRIHVLQRMVEKKK